MCREREGGGGREGGRGGERGRDGDVHTVFYQINAAATILFTEHNLWLQFEGGH